MIVLHTLLAAIAVVAAAAPAPAAQVAHHCDDNDRTCFPHDLTGPSADRGSGRIAYTVWIAGYETIKAESGEPISESFVSDVIHLDVPSGGVFGWGENEAIDAWVEKNMPGYTVMDAQVKSRELTFEEF